MDRQVTSTQKKFKHKRTIKRNKHIFDLKKMKTVESQSEKQRRVPNTVFPQQTCQKFRTTFFDSTTAFSSRRDEDIGKYKKRISSGLFKKYKTQETEASINLQKQPIVSVSEQILKVKREDKITKMLTYDESRFNNFKTYPLQPSKIRSFDQYVGRKGECNINHTLQLSSDKISQIYDKIIFNESSMKCTWKYKLQKPIKELSYLKKKDKDIGDNEIQFEKVQASREKVLTHWRKIQNEFKYQLSLQKQSQFNIIYDADNANWRQHLPKQKKQPKGIKFRTNKNKQVKFDRSDLCDIKFFRIEECKQKRVNKHQT